MKSDFEILEIVKQTIKKESESIKKLLDYVDNEFATFNRFSTFNKGNALPWDKCIDVAELYSPKQYLFFLQCCILVLRCIFVMCSVNPDSGSDFA